MATKQALTAIAKRPAIVSHRLPFGGGGREFSEDAPRSSSELLSSSDRTGPFDIDGNKKFPRRRKMKSRGGYFLRWTFSTPSFYGTWAPSGVDLS
jgi:hypothetical protein